MKWIEERMGGEKWRHWLQTTFYKATPINGNREIELQEHAGSRTGF